MSILGVLESAATAAEEAIAEARGKEAASVLPEVEDIGERMDADAKRIAELASDKRRNPVTTRREIRNILLLTLALCLLGCGGTPPTPSPSPPCIVDMGAQLVSCEHGERLAVSPPR